MAKPAQPTVPIRDAYGTGIFRRRIRLRQEPGVASGELEDDFHHFAATVRHDGERVTGATGVASRYPWTTCPGAVDPLARLRGLALSRSLRSVARFTDPRAQCTHLFDLASLAVSLAASDRPGVLYDLAVPDRKDGATTITLHRDGELLLRWELEGIRIVSPDPFAGHNLAGGGFAAWSEAELDADTAEAAQVLRRGALIAMGRAYDMDQVPVARGFASAAGGSCYSFAPERVDDAKRVLGTMMDFTDAPEKLLAIERE